MVSAGCGIKTGRGMEILERKGTGKGLINCARPSAERITAKNMAFKQES